jgi:hypothetical protein
MPHMTIDSSFAVVVDIWSQPSGALEFGDIGIASSADAGEEFGSRFVARVQRDKLATERFRGEPSE